MAAQAWMWEAWMREAAACALGRGTGRGAGYVGPSVRARRRLVWLGARRGGGQGGRLARCTRLRPMSKSFIVCVLAVLLETRMQRAHSAEKSCLGAAGAITGANTGRTLIVE
jgi:hypothetical protein